jgi:hypothetical protein
VPVRRISIRPDDQGRVVIKVAELPDEEPVMPPLFLDAEEARGLGERLMRAADLAEGVAGNAN